MTPARLTMGLLGGSAAGLVLTVATAKVGHRLERACAGEPWCERIEAAHPYAVLTGAADAVARSELVWLAGQSAPALAAEAGSAWRPGQVAIDCELTRPSGTWRDLADRGVVVLRLAPLCAWEGTSREADALAGTTCLLAGPALYVPIAQALAAEIDAHTLAVAEDNWPLAAEAALLATTQVERIASAATRLFMAAGAPDGTALHRVLRRSIERVEGGVACGETHRVADGLTAALDRHRLAALDADDPDRPEDDLGDVAQLIASLADATTGSQER